MPTKLLHRSVCRVLILSLVAALLLVTQPSAASAAPKLCAGQVATIVGTSGPDVLRGTPGPDVIVGLGGDDVIRGIGGNDTICGNAGKDVIRGGGGSDLIYGGKGKDRIYGGAADDVLHGGSGADKVYGRKGNDRVEGNKGNDWVAGNAGDDTVLGGSGRRDNLRGNAGFDICVDKVAASIAGCESQDAGAIDIDPQANVDPECQTGNSSSYSTATARVMYGVASQAYEIMPGTPFADEDRLDDLGPVIIPFEENMSCWHPIKAFRGSFPGIADTEVLIAQNVQTRDLVVAFRGTEFDETADIVTDITSLRAPWRLPNGDLVENAVHLGFANAYGVVADEVETVLTNNEASGVNGAKVFFTGHSLGGALATLASVDLVDDMMDLGYERTDVALYTFGAPRALSLEMANNHRALVPHAHAVANSSDPVPQVPNAIGSNPFSHIHSMVLFHGDENNSAYRDVVRVDRGDGRNYRGCGRLDVGDHFRKEYTRRLSATNFLGAPRVWATLDGGEIRMNWTSPLEGSCDWVALYRSATQPTNPQNNLGGFLFSDGRRLVDADGNNTHLTTYGKGDNFWVGYVNMFGDFVATAEYRPSTPSVSLRRNENFIGGDTIDFVWSVSDPGDHDLVVLFDTNPNTVGPNGYYRSIVGRVEARARTNSPERTQIRVGSDPNDWWVAYIMIDDDGRQRILSTSRGVRG